MDIVNDEYWLSYAKRSVEGSVTRRNEAAAKLETVTLWFWGIYTTFFTIGVTIRLLDVSPSVMAFLASPIILVMLTYWFCVWTQLPVTATYDPRIPSEIIEGYNRGLRVKNRRFQATLALTFLSALSVALALYQLSLADRKDEPELRIALSEGKDHIILSGTVPKNKTITTTIDSLAGKTKTTFFQNSYQTGTKDELNLNVAVKPSGTTKYLITVLWKDESGKQKGLSQLIP